MSKLSQFAKLGRLKTAVISQVPIVSVTFTGADVSTFASAFRENGSAEVKLFGFIPLGGANESYQVNSVETSTGGGSVTITFGPPNLQGQTPDNQSTAYLMGGVPSYPPNND